MARNALDERTCFPNIIRVETILRLVGFFKLSLQKRMDTCCLLNRQHIFHKSEIYEEQGNKYSKDNWHICSLIHSGHRNNMPMDLEESSFEGKGQETLSPGVPLTQHHEE